MSRILAIDYGKKRTGLAVTDPLKIIPNGLTTVNTKDVISFLINYVQKESVELIVIGLPIQMNGLPSENQQRVRQFAVQLSKTIPSIPIVFYDERFTSKIAHQTMLDAGLTRKARRDKALVDEISATIILQSYLDSLQIK